MTKTAEKAAAAREANPHEANPDEANPKLDPKDTSNRIKDPSEWTTGGEPMTGAQASYLKTLSEQATYPDAFSPDLDKAEASQRIDALRKDTGRD